MKSAGHTRNLTPDSAAADNAVPQDKARDAAVADPGIDLDERRRLIAYQLWEEEGRPEGKADEHWSRACAMVASLDQCSEKDPRWLQRQQDAQASRQASKAPPESGASLDAIRRSLAERKTA